MDRILDRTHSFCNDGTTRGLDAAMYVWSGMANPGLPSQVQRICWTTDRLDGQVLKARQVLLDWTTTHVEVRHDIIDGMKQDNQY